MAEHDILNPDVTWREDLEDALGPDFGWEMMRKSQLAIDKAAFGRPLALTVGNGGHAAQFSWLNRSRKCVEYLKRWAEQHEDGFFTIIDHDWRGRHYVGRFVGDMPYTEAGNDRYNIQGWTFEEVPGVPMVKYPSEWEHWAVKLRPFDDFGGQAIASFSATAGAWHAPAPALNDRGNMQASRAIANFGPTVGDWLTYQYRGYGFRLWLAKSPSAGVVQIYVDDVLVQDNLVLTNAVNLGPQIAYEKVGLPLDVHRVRVVVIAATPPAQTLAGFLWDHIEAMR